MEDGERRMENGGWRTEDGEWRMESWCVLLRNSGLACGTIVEDATWVKG